MITERAGFVTDPTEDERICWVVGAAALAAGVDLATVVIDRDLEIIDVVVRVGWLRSVTGLGLDDAKRAKFRQSVREMLGMCGLDAYARWPLSDAYVR